MNRNQERRRGKLDYGRLTVRDKMRERGFEDVANFPTVSARKLRARKLRRPQVARKPRPPQSTKAELRALAEAALREWNATRTSS